MIMKPLLIALCLSTAFAAEKAPTDKPSETIVLTAEQGKEWREIELMVERANNSVAFAKVALAEAEKALPDKQKSINMALAALLKTVGCVGCAISEIEKDGNKQLVAVKPPAKETK